MTGSVDDLGATLIAVVIAAIGAVALRCRIRGRQNAADKGMATHTTSAD